MPVQSRSRSGPITGETLDTRLPPHSLASNWVCGWLAKNSGRTDAGRSLSNKKPRPLKVHQDSPPGHRRWAPGPGPFTCMAHPQEKGRVEGDAVCDDGGATPKSDLRRGLSTSAHPPPITADFPGGY